ncbi:MAG: cytochrome c biogenesis protein ResB [Opitutales bacterium]
MKTFLAFFSSLRLTVVLLVFSMALVFFGTLEQVNYGIWHTQKLYFESFFALWSYPEQAPLHDYLFWVHIPLPGGYLLGGLLLVNLVVAHLQRFKLAGKKSGIFLIHIGLILLIVSEFLTSILAVESQMAVDEEGRKNYSESYRENELVFIDRTPPDHDLVHKIPVEYLKEGETVDVPDTPLQVRTKHYFPNARVGRSREGADKTPANRGVASRMSVVASPEEMDYGHDAVNTATAYVEVLGPEGSLGTWLVSNFIDERYPPQKVELNDQSWEIDLRFERYYYPFELELIDFSHDKYPGTDRPYNFSSVVRVHHEDPGKDRKALIYMNHPLRYEGLTFYQFKFANNDTTSIFQVVRNPGWLLPYISVLLMAAGMIIQFGMHFFKFLRKRR